MAMITEGEGDRGRKSNVIRSRTMGPPQLHIEMMSMVGDMAHAILQSCLSTHTCRLVYRWKIPPTLMGVALPKSTIPVCINHSRHHKAICSVAIVRPRVPR
eukprot:scaffold343525_cov23-Prasinocladus_malaysianus.AAC.1